MTTSALDKAIAAVASEPVLLIACDYDGTVAPIVEDPDAAAPERESVAALRLLASMPDTEVAVISGRSLRDLAALSRLPQEIHLVGSHGSEFDVGFSTALDDDLVDLRNRVTVELEDIADGHPGVVVELKPASVAFHYRRVAPDVAERMLNVVRNGPATRDGIRVKEGKKVIELAVVDTDKGIALDRIRSDVSASAVLFMGDDVTDEDAFVRLAGPDVGVKVGDGQSAAAFRVDDTTDVARVLAALAERRRSWLEGAISSPIERHSLLSDRHTFALLTPDASVNWMCLPAPDGAAVFADLLGGRGAGHFSVAVESSAEPISQRYVDNTVLVETRWADLNVVDYLAYDETTESSVLVRSLSGDCTAVVEFVPRGDYGRAPTGLRPTDNGLAVTGMAELLALRSPGVEWEIRGDSGSDTATARIDLRDGETVVLVFGPAPLPVFDEPSLRAQVVSESEKWVENLRLPATNKRQVARSALVLRSLCHEPSGALAAGATSSLPEQLGGVRNWDYRFCWPRDAAMAVTCLARLGSVHEGEAFLHWLSERVHAASAPEQLRPVYPLNGDASIPEAILPHLAGYRGSRPVRIGNAAEHQVQLDVFGPIVEAVATLVDQGVDLLDEQWDLVCDMVSAVERRWDEPDHGMWEERRPQRHHVHSKVMCWQAVDRAMRIAAHTGRYSPEHWVGLADKIADDVTTNGWNSRVDAFTIAYGDDELDAAALWVGLSGLLQPDDARFVSTIKAIERDLRDGPIVYRYRLDDGLPGTEGGFLICSSWLMQAYVLTGQFDEAQVMLRDYVALAGPTGLLSEQFDPVGEVMLGNHPQAYSHLGLIDAALALDATFGLREATPAATE
jgi:trehalose 6-phosphate phosphatase